MRDPADRQGRASNVRVKLPALADWKAQVKCQAACPATTDAGRYVQLIAEGRDVDAYLAARAPNPFASVCGRVCAAPCEDACRRGSIDAPVAIRGLKRFVTERYGVESVRPGTQDRLLASDLGKAEAFPHEPEGNRFAGHLPLDRRQYAGRESRRVAVVGAGPAGLTAAHDLALFGYDVTVFDAAKEPGGMLRFGIPEYRLPRTLLSAEIEKILSLGVTLRSGVGLAPSFGLSALREQGFAAVFLAVGVSQGRDLHAPGADLDGVVKAVDYLLNVNRGYRMDLGRRVVVIGGGFVAFDAARTALRGAHPDLEDAAEAHLRGEADARAQEAIDSARAAVRAGADEVTIVSLENFDEMPVLRTTQGLEEFEEARKEGVRFVTRRGPRRFVGEGRLQRIQLQRVLSVFDGAGRFSPAYDAEDVVEIEADSCILAIGQRPDLSFLGPEDGIELGPTGSIKVDPVTLATTAPGVFAGGDVAFGPRNLIEAVANGKRAARAIHEYFDRGCASLSATLDIERIPTGRYRMVAGFERLDREAPPTLDVGRRTGIAEVETGYGPANAREQAARCLVCHVQTIYDPEKCVLCGRCVDVCPEYCLALVPIESIEMAPDERAQLVALAEPGGLPLAAMIKDDEKCIRCGLCAIRCPTDAMTMERFTVTERLTRDT